MDGEDDVFGLEDPVSPDPGPLRVRAGKRGAMLSKDDEWQLIQKSRAEDRKATAQISATYEWLVRSVARKIGRNGAVNLIPLDDMVQLGFLGLFDAIRLYDACEEASFATYATQRIRGAILDALRELSPVSRSLMSAVRKAEEIYENLAHSLLRKPTLREWRDALPAELREEFEDIRVAQVKRKSVLQSLTHYNLDDEEVPDVFLTRENSTMSVEDELIAEEEGDPMKGFSYLINESVLAQLDDRQRELIYFRYLAPADEILTLMEVGERFGVTESRVCQMETEALGKLRRYLRMCYRSEVAEALGKPV